MNWLASQKMLNASIAMSIGKKTCKVPTIQIEGWQVYLIYYVSY